jgi:integrase
MPRAKGSRTKTDTPGVYKLEAGGYEFVWRNALGRQQSARASTKKLARSLKGEREAEAAGGSTHDRTMTVAAWARRWVETYQGKGGGKTFAPRQRDDYRRDVERYVVPFLGTRKLVDVRRDHVRKWVAWLADDAAQERRHEQENERRQLHNASAAPGDRQPKLTQGGALKDATIRRIFAVLSAMMRTAADDGVIAASPCTGVVLPVRTVIVADGDDVDEDVKALTRAELAAVLRIAPAKWSVFFHLLAATGLRVSEAMALTENHLVLTGERPVVKVRRAIVLGEGRRLALGPPKSKYGVRDLPLPWPVADALAAHVRGLPDQPPAARKTWGRLIFRTEAGTPFLQENLRRRVLAPVVGEAGAEWAGFHAFRHTFASMHIEAGTNIVRLSRLLGHHAPSFTLDTYAHLLDDGMGDPLDMTALLEQGDSMGTAEPSETGRDPRAEDPREPSPGRRSA